MNHLFLTLSAIAFATCSLPLGAVTPASITMQPRSLTVVTGQTASFTVVATGSPPLTYQWRFNSLDIPGATGSNFIKSNVQLPDAGGYSVMVANSVRTVISQQALLTVVVPPSITTQPTNRDAVVGGGATFTVAASGGGLWYQWRFAAGGGTNTVNVPGATNATLNLVNLQPADAGAYRVVVTNLAGSVTSASASLTVLAITGQPQNQSVAVGSNAVLSVAATGKAPLHYQWHFNNGPLPGATNATLVIPQTQPLHSGFYYAAVANVAGAITSSTAQLTVALVPSGAVWKYLDDGSDQGTDWREYAFDDSTWPSGPAKLGYGDTNEMTLLQRTRTNGTLIVTTYLRRGFYVGNAALYSNLTARFLRDDGVVVYLNGREILRSNMPTGDPTYATFASVGVAGSEETNYFQTALSPGLLRDGLNQLAVELHQVPATSDAGFDFELFGQAAPLPVITTQPVTRSVALGAAVVTFSVGGSGGGPFRFQWLKNGQRLAGATNASLTLSNVREPGGGSYEAVLMGPHGATRSQPAELLFLVPSNPAAADSFASAASLSGVSNRVRGSSIGASKEPFEPDHAGKRGGRSVWYTWTPQASGVASFRTQGSSFDTLLGIYTGTNVAALEPVASDEDSGGYHTSEVSFNALAGTTYRIAVDGLGFGGAQGNFLLSWTHEVTSARLPVLTNAPGHRTALLGSDVTLTVGAVSPGTSYQWLFNDIPIAGAVSPTLTMTNVLPDAVGFYRVRATSASGRSLLTTPALVELSSSTNSSCFDKREDFFYLNKPAQGGGGTLLTFQPAGGLTATTNQGSIQVFIGSIDYSVSPTGTGSGGDPMPCEQYYEGTAYHYLTNLDVGFIEVDTFGSFTHSGAPLLTRMAVYRRRADGDTPIQEDLVACDHTSANEGRPSRVCFPALDTNRVYEVVLAPLDGVQGTIVMTNRLAPMHYFYKSPSTQPLRLTLSERLGNPTYRWLRDNAYLAPSTAPSVRSWNLGPVGCDDTGTYTVELSRNGVPFETNVVAHVHVHEWTKGATPDPFPLLYDAIEPATKAHMRILAWSPDLLELWATEIPGDVLQAPEGAWQRLETTSRVTDPRVPLCYLESNLPGRPRRFFLGVVPEPTGSARPCP